MGFLDWLSLGLDICPGIGEAKAILELISGKDLITQEELNAFDRATCAISIIPAAGWLAKMSTASKEAKYAPKFEKFFNLVNKANEANDCVDKLNFIRQILEDSGYNTSKMIFKGPAKMGVIQASEIGIDTAQKNKNNNSTNKVTTKNTKSNNTTNQTTKNTKINNNKKSIGEIANEVIRGNWGNGNERKKRLEAAGYNYQEVQNEVNRRLKK